MTGMTLWRMEWLRLVRTGRLWILVAVYALFGVLGPFSARYISQIVERFGGGVEIVVPDPTPLDGMVQFYSNAGQIGLLAVVAVAAAAMTFDAQPQWAAFLRTRVPSVSRLLQPRVVMSSLGAVIALVVGTALAAGLTGVLIGAVPVREVALGTALGALYLAFAVSVTAVAASVARQTVTTVLLTVGVLVVLPIAQVVAVIDPWLPSKLLGATTALLGGQELSELLTSAAVTVVTIPALLWLAARRLDAREA